MFYGMGASENLNAGEEMVLSLRPHKLFLAPPVFGLVGAVTAAVIWSSAGLVSDANQAAKLVVAGVMVVAVLFAGWSWLEWRFTRFHLTSQRVLMWAGVLSRRRVEIPLDRVNTVFVDQTIFERVMRCGKLSIESAGEGGKETFPQCPRPLDVKQAIHRQKHSSNGLSHASQHPQDLSGRFGGLVEPGDVPGGLAGQLERLVTMRDQGALDEWEFAEAKAKVLAEYGSSPAG